MKIVILAATALLLTACTPMATTSINSTVNNAELTGDKALYAAEAAYVGALDLVNKGLDAGLIKGDNAAKVNGYVKTAYSALLAARQARATGDTALETASALAVLASASSATAAIPAK